MLKVSHLLIAAMLRRSKTGLGRKVRCFCILILLTLPFQPLGAGLETAEAAERLPIVLLQELKSNPGFTTLLSAIQAAGFVPRTIREDDFSFNITPQNNHTVIVPVGNHISPEAMNQLTHYVAKGGRLIIIPLGTTPDASVVRLLSLVELPIGQWVHAPAGLPLNWKGLAQGSGESLPQESALLRIQPNLQTTILATWGSDLPAIATTSKGALLNWRWGQQLSSTVNTIALAKVVYPGRPDPLILMQQEDNDTSPKAPTAPTEELMPPAPVSTRKALPSPSGSSSTLTDETAQPQTIPTQSIPIARPAMPSAAVPIGQPDGSPGVSPSLAGQKNSSETSHMSAAKPNTASKKTVAGAKATSKGKDNDDDEVLNNILGLPGGDSPKSEPSDDIQKSEPSGTQSPDNKPTTEASGSTPMTSPKNQQHFSFLDPDAASVLAPAFDYGVYSMNLRKLDDYKRRVKDALEAGRQLSLNLPEAQVNVLLKESDLHKRKFESLYLSGQTQAGLDENTLAHHSALQALALTTTSPRVEGRAIWLDRGSIIASGGPEGLKKRMQKLHQAGINIVYFETVNAGFPIYPSKLVKHNPLVNNWDPLKVAVEEGHKQGMEVHAWVWAFAVGNRRHNAIINQPEEYAGPILTEGGMMSEALRNHEGGLSVDSRQHEFWLSPASPKGREFLLNLYQEIVSNYDVDGLQLDYIRYPFQTSGNRMGYEAIGRERFAQATGQSLDSGDDYNNRIWTAWKTYQVSSFVQQVSNTLKKIKPELKLSAAVFPMHREARIAAIQQDWETWIDNGWIDTLSPMSYTSDPERLQDLFEYVQHSPRKHPLVYPGIALHRLDGGQLVQHLEALRQKGGLGTTLFAGSHLDDDKAGTLAAGPFKSTDSMTPHHDVVKSMQAIVADYQEKLTGLQQNGSVTTLSPQQQEALQAALQQFNASLAALGSGRPLSGISHAKLQVAEQALRHLSQISQSWSDVDKTASPYRAAYFERDLLLLNELMGYTADKLGLKTENTLTLQEIKPSASAPTEAEQAPLTHATPATSIKEDSDSMP